MRILISAIYDGSWPYVPDMVLELSQKGISCDVYDTAKHEVISSSLSIKRSVLIHPLLKYFLKLPKIGIGFGVLFHLVYYLRHLHKYNIHCIHYIQPMFAAILPFLRYIKTPTVTVAWGSDVFRVNKSGARRVKKTIQNSQFLVGTKPLVEFVESNICPPLKSCKAITSLNVLSKSIDNLHMLAASESMENARKTLGIPNDSFVVTFGYNASTAQQHILFCDALEKIKKDLPENFFVLLPMTYSENEQGYITDIKCRMQNINIPHIIFDTFLSDWDNLRIRLITDLTVNIQTTDALSSSIREHLFMNKPVLVGDWLPYSVLEELDVFFLKTTITELDQNLLFILNNYEDIRGKCKKNEKIIYNNFSLSQNISGWINFFKEIDQRK